MEMTCLNFNLGIFKTNLALFNRDKIIYLRLVIGYKSSFENTYRNYSPAVCIYLGVLF